MASTMSLKPSCKLHTSVGSSFSGTTVSLQKLSISGASARPLALTVEAKGKHCQLTGKKANNGYVVTFSHKRNHKLQEVNLQRKKVWWPEEQRFVQMRISTKAIKTIEKKGLAVMAKEAGLDLYSLPYEDHRPERREWLKNNPPAGPPIAKNPRAMKNPIKLASSKKGPRVPQYVQGNRIRWVRTEVGGSGKPQ